MKFSSYIFLVTYIMASIGIASASLNRELGSGFILASALALILSLPFNLSAKKLPPALWNIFALLAAVAFAADYAFITHTLLGSASRFLTVLAAAKLFDLKTDRDYFLLFALTFFQLLSAAAATTSPIFFILLAAFIITSIWAMILFNVKRDFQAHCKGEASIPPSLFKPGFFLTTLVLTAASLFITLALFFTIPRIGFGYFERASLDTIQVSGFSDRVELGSIGPVKKDRTVIMRVSFTLPGSEAVTGHPEEDLYFRGQALDHYDGTAWSKTITKEVAIRNVGGRFNFGMRGKNSLTQRILLEPLNTETIFAADMPVSIEPLSISGAIGSLWRGSDGSLNLSAPPFRRIEYSAVSVLPDYERPSDNATSPPDAAYLEKGSISDRVARLALDIASSSRGDLSRSRAIERHLKGNYSYTLSPKRGDYMEIDPVDDFLFYSKEGYCEHFATSMVLLLRSLSIPARIVTGFLQGEWNGYGRYLLVRQQDAHTWVEAFIEGRGWMRFDPTPSAGLVAPIETSALALYADSLRMKWNRYIIKFSLSDQIKGSQVVEGRINAFIKKIKKELSSLSEKSDEYAWQKRALAALLASAVILITVIILRRIKSGRSHGFSGKRDFYQKMERILKRTGLRRGETETPAEFAARCSDDKVILITEAFEKMRYGGKVLSIRELREVRTTLKLLKSSG